MATPDSILAKTPKGADEVARRSHGLGPRVRQMLILIDGKRDAAALLAMFPPEVGATLLSQLVEGGFVRAMVPGELPRPPGTIQPAVALAGHTAPAPLGAADEEDPFVLGQTFMVNLARRILGIAGDPIIAKLRAAHDTGDLRALYLEWRSTIKQAPDGLLRLKELEKKLAKVLGDLPTP